jgi:hypothetical protein
MLRRLALVRAAGTGGIRNTLMAIAKPGQKILLHKAPVYPTTLVTLEAMGLKPIHLDFNDLDVVRSVTGQAKAEIALVQHTRQRVQDRYRLHEVIAALKEGNPQILIIADDNYAAMRVPKIGIQMGATISTFSLFKLLGPEGLGCILAPKAIIEKIRKQAYSGGTQVQGPEAMSALRMLVFAPVALAIQGEVVAEVSARLNRGEVEGVKGAYIANAQSRVVLVELESPLAQEVIKKSISFGAATHPVGAESRYEIAPLFYRVSYTFMEENPDIGPRMIRINPMRAGADLVINILKKSLTACQERDKHVS